MSKKDTTQKHKFTLSNLVKVFVVVFFCSTTRTIHENYSNLFFKLVLNFKFLIGNFFFSK